jgi:hypothetical protein
MQHDLVNPSIPQLGAIKIGGLKSEARVSNGVTWYPPEKWDHFKIMRPFRDKSGRLVVDDDLMNRLAEEGKTDSDGKLRQIPIQVFSDDIDEILQSSYLWYHGKKLAARFDGVNLTWHYDTKTNAWLETPNVEPYSKDDFLAEYKDLKDKRGGKIFKLHTIFNCAILAQDARWGGVYRFRTSSDISSSELKGSLMNIKDLTRGPLRGVPLRLVLRPVVVNPVIDGKKVTTTVYVVHVELLGSDLVDIQRKAIEFANFEMQSGRTRLEYRKYLSAPGEFESPREQAEIASEFCGVEPVGTELEPPAHDPLMDTLGLNGSSGDAGDHNDTELPEQCELI